ncbi:MAG: non-canonical purine NTP pyrophosphatase [Nanoarchaeota archaeon]|nr:non-canonical purine NTP pyrophosphatase [Nanoarchaeota archaeon]
MTKIVYATTNPGKLTEMRRHFSIQGIEVLTMHDLGCNDIDVPEPGTTLGENAKIKVRAYLDELAQQRALPPEKILVLSDDTGLEIDTLNGEPGIHVRRWKGYRMDDEEIIAYALERLNNIPYAQRGAEFRSVVAVGVLGADKTKESYINFFEGTLRGSILETPLTERVNGFPFESLLFIDEWDMSLYEASHLPTQERICYFSHRERAIQAALPFIIRQTAL